MTVVLPKDAFQARICAGSVFVRTASSVAVADLMLRTGEFRTGFTQMTDAETLRAGISSEIQLPLVKEPLVKAMRGKCKVHLNKMEGWALEGGQTLQVEVSDPSEPFLVDLTKAFELPATNVKKVFRVLLAAHRASGVFVLNLTNPADGTKRSFKRNFNVNKRGGKVSEKYENVEIALPSLAMDTVLTMSVQFEQALSAEDSPWFFIAQPVLADEKQMTTSVPMLEFTAADAGMAEAGQWSQAALPNLLEPSEELSLDLAGITTVLVPATDATVSLVQDWGHTIQLRASVDGVYKIHISNADPMIVHLNETPTTITFPSPCLDGRAHLLQVTDSGDCRLFYKNYFLIPRILTPIEVLQAESSPPFPSALMSQAAHRYDSLRAQMACNTRSSEDYAQIAWALSILEGGFGNVKLKPLRFPEVAEPDVSIVIPAHNKIEVTYLGLCSLLMAYNSASFEVILVDDASTDETAELENLVEGITVIHNTQAQRFIRACNAGAAKARGKYVVLLNNDVEVTTGWLDELIAAFERFPNVGLAGAKLLYPNGQLQEAGGIIWGTGNPWNYGNRQNPWEPRFSYARQADYLSGAAMMTTRDIWNEVGGLSSYLEPMYFEDTDFAFKVRDAGYSTWCIPSSVVYHYEGMTSGTDTSSGFKQFQEVNRPKFKRRWSKAFANFSPDGQNPDFEKDRGIVGRVLFIDHEMPRPDRDAGSYAAIKEIELVQSLGYKVTFLPRNLAHMGRYTDDLQRMGVEVIYAPFFLSAGRYLEEYGKDFDAVYITRYYVADDLLSNIRENAPHAKVLFNNADLHFLRELRTGLAAGDANQVAEAGRTREMELNVMRRVDVVLSYNDVEHSVITSHIDGAVPVVKCPWVVELSNNPPPLAERSGISFLGSFRHHPNGDGVKWFVNSVMPLVKSAHPDLSLTIYGSGMGDDIKSLAASNIHPEGFIEDIADAYDRFRIFAAPLLSGAGIKGKVLSALAHGIPCVLTPVAAEGVGLRHGHDCFIVKSPKDWAEAIGQLQTDDALWQRMSDNARAYVADAFSFEKGREMMREAFETVDLYQSN